MKTTYFLFKLNSAATSIFDIGSYNLVPVAKSDSEEKVREHLDEVAAPGLSFVILPVIEIPKADET